MITREEIVPYATVLTEAQDKNVSKLLVKMQAVRAAYGLPMIVTSGFRTAEENLRIDPDHPNSAHTKGSAVDIYDPEKRLWNWCIENIDILVQVDLYLEDKLFTPNHVHFQDWKPASGNRIFKP